MSKQEQVVNTINKLPEELVNQIYDYMQYLLFKNDYVVTAEDLKIFEENDKDLANGIYYTHEEVWGE